MHTGQTLGIDSFLSTERHRIMDAASPAKREQMRAAEGARGIYRAWNAVVGGTREGRHATGLRYLPETNELLVYMDSPSWTQEMTLLREIVRARMERAGAHVDGLIFKTTRPGYAPAAAAEPLRPRPGARPPAPRCPAARGAWQGHESECRVEEGRIGVIRALNRVWWPCSGKEPVHGACF